MTAFLGLDLTQIGAVSLLGMGETAKSLGFEQFTVKWSSPEWQGLVDRSLVMILCIRAIWTNP
ncbi:hypothetical protein C0081_15175 [Cohaesibacter celericrescens]|uniref:Uncharacterized protein n=1 Tax=Cohaesibacter celericrescens TaxID=2067669 RepID=A0A2N5XP13_9HYPH|nr:hypothetical protein C0081_15175 [Cohaesibacter celericrescens]